MFRSTSVDMPGTVPVQLYCQMRKSSGAVGVGTLYSASHTVTLERNSSASLNRVSSETLRRTEAIGEGRAVRQRTAARMPCERYA